MEKCQVLYLVSDHFSPSLKRKAKGKDSLRRQSTILRLHFIKAYYSPHLFYTSKTSTNRHRQSRQRKSHHDFIKEWLKHWEAARREARTSIEDWLCSIASKDSSSSGKLIVVQILAAGHTANRLLHHSPHLHCSSAFSTEITSPDRSDIASSKNTISSINQAKQQNATQQIR